MKISSSRPTTAKKMMLSPRSHKTKSEGKDLDLTQLCDAIQETIFRQKQAEGKGKYVEAEGFKRRVKALKEELEDRQMDQYHAKHEKELKSLEEAHLAEMNLCGLEWQKRIDDYNQEIDRLLQELREKHHKQMVISLLLQKDIENEQESEKKFHESPKLLELRKVEQELGRQENYIEAHRVQVTANKQEKTQIDKHHKSSSSRKQKQMAILKTRQESDLEALKMRIQLQVEERERERVREEEILQQKFENILRQTEFQQNQELNTLNKRVKLSQLNRKSKVVGQFSLSKE